MTKSRYLTMAKAFAVYDILALAPFALPWLAMLQFNVFATVHSTLGLPGASITAPDPNLLVLVNMLGTVGVTWSVWRLRNMTVPISIFEGWVRAIFACLMLYAALFNGASAVWLLFGLIDVVAAPLHLLGYRYRSAS